MKRSKFLIVFWNVFRLGFVEELGNIMDKREESGRECMKEFLFKFHEFLSFLKL